MLNGINHVALIISKEECLDFYFRLGFKEESRVFRKEKGDYLIMLNDGSSVLEVFLRSDAPMRHCKPEAYGCRHIAFNVKKLEDVMEALRDYKQEAIRVSDSGQRFVFITDSDGQPVEFLEEK